MDSLCPGAPADLGRTIKTYEWQNSRLPESLGEHLNRRLADGEARNRLLTWLNSLPKVQSIVAQYGSWD